MIKDKDHDKLVEGNVWLENLDEVIAFIKAASAKPEYTPEGQEIPGRIYWSWASNMNCKYIDLRFDMRDGAFVLRDREGNRISLKQLKWQYGKEST